jgi:hypothetical protein
MAMKQMLCKFTNALQWWNECQGKNKGQWVCTKCGERKTL